jgi:hypothetical protein
MTEHKPRRPIHDYIYGEFSILDMMFKMPPRKPDSRMYFLGGCGLITLVRGLNIIFGNRPEAEVFGFLGPWFITFWGSIWIFIGISVMAVAGTGHWKAELDRSAAFLLMAVWWIWALLYLISSILPGSVDRLTDLLTALILAVTGLVLSAGIIQGIRKTQALKMQALTLAELHLLQAQTLEVVNENKRMRKQLADLEDGGQDE